MTREQMKPRKGRYFLYDDRRREYFHGRGEFDDGNGPQPYTYWTPYFFGAMGFPSLKVARAMRAKLVKPGVHLVIVDRAREVAG